MENKGISELLALVPLEATDCSGNSVSCLQSLKSRLITLFSSIGYDHFVLAEFPTSEVEILGPDLFLVVSFDEKWSDRYPRQGYDQIDPLFSRCLLPSSTIFTARGTWTDCHRNAAAQPLGETKHQKFDYVQKLDAFFADAANHGYRSGVIVGDEISGRRINLSLASEADPEAHDKRLEADFWALLALTLYTVSKALHAIEACTVCHRGVDIDITLTPAEAQWFQAILDYPNQTLEEIAKRLNRSINTGNSHIRNVKERLGITVKTPLLAQALKRNKKL